MTNTDTTAPVPTLDPNAAVFQDMIGTVRVDYRGYRYLVTGIRFNGASRHQRACVSVEGTVADNVPNPDRPHATMLGAHAAELFHAYPGTVAAPVPTSTLTVEAHVTLTSSRTGVIEVSGIPGTESPIAHLAHHKSTSRKWNNAEWSVEDTEHGITVRRERRSDAVRAYLVLLSELPALTLTALDAEDALINTNNAY